MRSDKSPEISTRVVIKFYTFHFKSFNPFCHEQIKVVIHRFLLHFSCRSSAHEMQTG